MTTWTSADLDHFDAQEIGIAGQRPDGSLRKPVIVWAVRLGDELYTRSVNGPDAAWFRGTRAQRRGQISAAGVSVDVDFVDADADAVLNDAIDAAYYRKYGRHPGPVRSITSALARSTTLKVVLDQSHQDAS